MGNYAGYGSVYDLFCSVCSDGNFHPYSICKTGGKDRVMEYGTFRLEREYYLYYEDKTGTWENDNLLWGDQFISFLFDHGRNSGDHHPEISVCGK